MIALHTMDNSWVLLKQADQRPNVFYFTICYAILTASILLQQELILLVVVPITCLIFNGLEESAISHLAVVLGLSVFRGFCAFK